MNIIFHKAISNVRVYPKSENWDLNWHHKVVYNYKRKIGRKFLFFPIYEIHDKGVVEEGAFSDNKFYTMEEVSKWEKTYIEDDKFDKSDALHEYLWSLDYVIYKHLAPLFNPNNFYDDKQDIFKDANGSQVVSANIFCHHKDVTCPIDTNKFAMMPITKP